MKISVGLPALPDLPKVGSNARKAHWAQVARFKREERDKWRILLIQAGYTLRTAEEGPVLRSPVHITATLYFRDHRLPDEHNLAEAIKVLVDLLQVNRLIQLSGSSWRQTGFSGLIDDDRNLIWDQPPRIQVDKEIAPFTVLTLTGAGHAK